MKSNTHRRPNRTARAIFAVEELAGWAVAVTGFLFALSAFFVDGLDAPFATGEALRAHATDAGFQLLLFIGGIIAVAHAQTNRAVLDNAEFTRDLLMQSRLAPAPLVEPSGEPSAGTTLRARDGRARREPSISLGAATEDPYGDRD